MNRQDLKQLNDYLMGTSNKSHVMKAELDVDAVVKEFNEKWAMFASIKNKEVIL